MPFARVTSPARMPCWKSRRRKTPFCRICLIRRNPAVLEFRAHSGKRRIMKTHTRLLFYFVVVSMVAGMLLTRLSLILVGAVAPSPSTEAGAQPSGTSKETCQSCHGPFDKLVASANYQAPSGEKISPHRYVPHNATEVKAIPECSTCHEPHPVPLPANVPKGDVQWCYTTCHHKHTFQACKDCHSRL